MKQKSLVSAVELFTLIELIVVIAIIGVIMALVLPALSKARAVGKRTACLSNLRQIGTGIQLYNNDSNFNPVPFTSMLFPLSYLSSNKAYLCPADLNKELNTSLTDNDAGWLERIDKHFSATRIMESPTPVSTHPAYDVPDNIGVNSTTHNDASGNVSYFYEMSDMRCRYRFKDSSGTEIGDSDTDRDNAGFPRLSKTTWALYKEWELKYGNNNKPYSVAAFPIYRCFWHIKHIKNYYGTNIPNDEDPVINITYAGNCIISKATWGFGTWSP
jgi:prepilin-type N-terminal cleavage/methylation domain-containing protein